MHLPRNGREYVTWPITGQPVGATFEISVDDGAWSAMETVAIGARKLFAGPDAVLGTATLLALGDHSVEIRLTDSPEIIVRDGDVIRVD